MHVTEAGDGRARAPAARLSGEFPRVRAGAAGTRDRAHVIVPDLRGAGRTDAPAGGYDLQTVVAMSMGLLDELGIQRTALVAHDWSALVAFELCLAHPERVSSLSPSRCPRRTSE